MNIEELKKKIICPKCGAKATSFNIYNTKRKTKTGINVHPYIYLVHYCNKEHKYHKWFLAPFSETLVEQLNEFGIIGNRSKIVLEGDKLEALRKYFLHKKGYTKEEKMFAKEFMGLLVNSKKAIVMIY